MQHKAGHYGVAWSTPNSPFCNYVLRECWHVLKGVVWEIGRDDDTDSTRFVIQRVQRPISFAVQSTTSDGT
jgi:hypothetical protein